MLHILEVPFVKSITLSHLTPWKCLQDQGRRRWRENVSNQLREKNNDMEEKREGGDKRSLDIQVAT